MGGISVCAYTYIYTANNGTPARAYIYRLIGVVVAQRRLPGDKERVVVSLRVAYVALCCYEALILGVCVCARDERLESKRLRLSDSLS